MNDQSEEAISKVDRLKLFRNAISRTKKIPFPIAVKVLKFASEDDFIAWLWKIDLKGFEIDYDTKSVNVTGEQDEISCEIDSLLKKYEQMEASKTGKL
ncbi:MAG: hypothetical protein ACXADA_24660 [Candidatus Hodarchaeales archaeon]|jgi:hypothetical protein